MTINVNNTVYSHMVYWLAFGALTGAAGVQFRVTYFTFLYFGYNLNMAEMRFNFNACEISTLGINSFIRLPTS